MRKELRQRLAREYRYAATKMQEAPTGRKLFYFSVLFSEAQRILNWEWNTDLVLVYTLTHHVHTQITVQSPLLNQLPLDMTAIFEKLTQIASQIASYFEKTEGKTTKEELYQILGQLADIAYIVSGNGSYLHEKGLINL